MAVVAATLAVLALIAFARSTAPIITDADLAVTELYVELATRAQLTVGPYSRFGWHHPGPLYFYLQAPLYAASGHRAAALFAGALAINLASLAAICWCLARSRSGAVMTLVPAAALLLAWRAPMFLASPWTGHVPILPAMLVLILTAGVASGRQWLAGAVIAGSLVVQTHVGFAPTVAALLAWSLVVAGATASGRRGLSRQIALAALSGLVLWLPTLAEASAHHGGNLVALARFFTAGGAHHSVAEALAAWSHGIAGVLRPSLGLPWGGHFVPDASVWAVPLGLGEVALLIAAGVSDARAEQRFAGMLAWAAALASVAGLMALTRIDGDILDHEIFWLSALGALNLAILAAAALRRLAGRLGWPHDLPHSWLATATVLAIAATLGISHLQAFTGFERRRSDRPSIVATTNAVRVFLDSQKVHAPLVDIDGPTWSHAAGVILRLVQDGRRVTLGSSSIPMFTPFFTAIGNEDARLTIGDRRRHQELAEREGNVVVREAFPVFVDALLSTR